MQTTVYSADKIFTGTGWQTGVAIVVKENTIHSIVPVASLEPNIEVKNFANCFIAPAFIDIQLYGAYKRLLSAYPDVETLSAINKYSRAGGASISLPTVATNTKEVFYKCIDAVRDYWKQGGKGIQGLHLEGPWINKEKRGAHLESLIHSPTEDEVNEILEYGKGVIKIITLAPEVCSDEVIKLIQSKGVIISAGHTNATYEDAMTAFTNGINTVTHLYNAMTPLQHRAPGVVGATMLHEKVRASIIADGYHVDFAAIKIAKQLMKDRLFVITDAVTGTEVGPYKHELNGDKYEVNGTLSGSALTMYSSFINLVKKAGIEVEEALRMCSLYPAEVLGCEKQYGKIEPGFAAQFIIIDNEQLTMESLITM
jgi:N-acetylglucosamine-6-phosphate deacetylase